MTGYSGTPLAKKLGIKDGFAIWLRYPPDHYEALFDTLPPHLEHTETDCDFVHAFYDERAQFEADISLLMAAIKPNGMIWISWPKKASRVPTDMTEDVIRAVALPLGLVDVKVCAVDAVWSGLKLMIRKERR